MKTNNRHLTALVISTMIYGVAIASILGFDTKNQPINKVNDEQTKSIKIALFRENQPIQPTKTTKKEDISQKQPEEKIIKKESKVIEKVVEKLPIEPIKKEIQPQIKPEPKIEKIVEKPIEKIVKNPAIEEKVVTVKPVTQPTIAQKTLLVNQTVQTSIPKIVKNEQNSQEILNKKKQYFQLIKDEIEKHKYYPPNALRRGIECDIKVKFIVSSMGQLVSLELIEGNKIFHNSVKEAIENSFPLMPPKNILSENEVLNLVISYTIN